ncbi:hypothetical protein DFH07DRAFT_958524 [Mycena maculata]|uniref:Uncharacterized protein n=1 Tax=Mycena maculata TaxID=230809 RepID=A0AAD7J6H1_9AGAR|nr:hypothetical protein DFH07DRAFT_958524 [Mycena maculata]
MKHLAEENEDTGSDPDGDDPLEDELDYDDFDLMDEQQEAKQNGLQDEDDVSDWETDDEYDVILDKQAKIDKSRTPVRHAFTPDHPLFMSHSITCRFENVNMVIPNFIGGAMPRSDKGDRAAYCMTMLTIFKPWRSPTDLKDVLSTWDQAFKEHEFTDRQLQLMRNFNVRYECNDARDDHFAQMKKKMAEAQAAGRSLFPPGFMGFKDKFKEDLNEFDYGSDDDEIDEIDEDDQKGPRTVQYLAEAKSMREIMQTSGWLDALPGGDLSIVDVDRVLPPYKLRTEWTNIVKHQRAALIENKLANLPPSSRDDASKHRLPNGTKLLPHDYFTHRSDVEPEVNAGHISDVIKEYGLNKEQVRAFKIVAEHASGPQAAPLRMYLGEKK